MSRERRVGLALVAAALLSVCAGASSRTRYDIRDYGAVGDGATVTARR